MLRKKRWYPRCSRRIGCRERLRRGKDISHSGSLQPALESGTLKKQYGRSSPIRQLSIESDFQSISCQRLGTPANTICAWPGAVGCTTAAHLRARNPNNNSTPWLPAPPRGIRAPTCCPDNAPGDGIPAVRSTLAAADTVPAAGSIHPAAGLVVGSIPPAAALAVGSIPSADLTGSTGRCRSGSGCSRGFAGQGTRCLGMRAEGVGEVRLLLARRCRRAVGLACRTFCWRDDSLGGYILLNPL
jgi:hypothetical protein